MSGVEHRSPGDEHRVCSGYAHQHDRNDRRQLVVTIDPQVVLPDSGADHDPHAGVALATTATLFYVLLALMVGTQIFANWLDKRSARRLPQGPAPGVGGQAPPRLPLADPGGRLPPVDPGHQIGESARTYAAWADHTP